MALKLNSGEDVAIIGFDDLPDSAFVRLPTVAGLFAVTPSCIWKWVKSGRFPAPIKLGPQTTAWRVSAIRSALASPAGKVA